MKKILFYYFIFILIVFSFPVFFTKKFGLNQSNLENIKYQEDFSMNKNQDLEKKEKYNYSNYGRIKLLHKKDNIVEEKNLDDYILEVISAEMPASYELEALKAQAIVARTYTIYMIENNKHEDADICDDSKCCQAWISKQDRLDKWEVDKKDEYWSKLEEAVKSTEGKIITYNGKAIDAFFHANSGGKTENVSSVWGGSDLPYLESVETAGEEEYNQYQSEVVLSKEDFENKIKEKHQNFEIDFNDAECIKISEYTDGNRVRTIKIGNLNLSGVEVRTLLGLKSANFNVEINNDENTIKISVRGYGHGVGMSQTGADSLAKNGQNYEQIIKHFYKNVEISNI